MTDEIPVSKVLVENSKGKFLVLQKSESYDGKAGKWELPGGKIKENLGEDRLDAARREIRDETGLKTEDFMDLVRTGIEDFREDKIIVNCWILYTDSFRGDVRLSDEHQEFRWVSAEEFRTMDWHRDAGYNLPAMVYLEEYLN